METSIESQYWRKYINDLLRQIWSGRPALDTPGTGR